MTRFAASRGPQRVLQFGGRLVLALGAGVGFAYLAYVPPPEDSGGAATGADSIETDRTVARRADVTDDVAAAQLKPAVSEWVARGDARTRSRDDVWVFQDEGQRTTESDGWSGRATAGDRHVAGMALTVLPNSRGPP